MHNRGRLPRAAAAMPSAYKRACRLVAISGDMVLK
jgi:hypothetical protein